MKSQYQKNIKRGMVLPFGVRLLDNAVHFSIAVPKGNECRLNLYHLGESSPFDTIRMTQEHRSSHIFSVQIDNLTCRRFEYMYEIEGKEFIDPYAPMVTGDDIWGELFSEDEKKDKRGSVNLEGFEWGEDQPLYLPYHDMILYKLHVRGFTKHPSSKVKKKGTFYGLKEKIPYLKELGINALELLPIYNFNEITLQKPRGMGDSRFVDYSAKTQEEDVLKIPFQINYWGYAEESYYFAPKTSFSSDPFQPDVELKGLIKELHKNGIEVIMEMYFASSTNQSMMLDALRHWVTEYHIDGFHIKNDQFPFLLVATDPMLSHIKLMSAYWNANDIFNQMQKVETKHLGEYNDGFMNDIRRYLKGDEGQVGNVGLALRKNPKTNGVINYITNTNGFTLMDLYSYDIKHNEDNGEDNRDGTEYNFSWNCGVEGKTRKKKIVELRKKQIMNALLTLFLGQGTPLILAGDEFGNSQEGNNNAYCQDNEISWLNWNLLKNNHDIYVFIRNLIRLRKAHPILHMEYEFRMMDYISCGYPDLSYHGTKAWYPEYSNYSRVLGLMFCGNYSKMSRRVNDDYFYIAFNMHWEPHEFDLPNLPVNVKWRVIIDTSEQISKEIILEKPEEDGLEDQKKYLVMPRCIVVFIGD